MEAHRARMTRIAIYTRLSSDPTGAQTATARQQEACERFAELRAWEPVVALEDVDVSAFKAGVIRPQYEELLKIIARGELDGVLVWKLDRLVRRPAEFERFWRACEANGTFLASVTEPIDSSTELGLALVRILVTFASLESATTALRIRARNEQAARAGSAPISARAYGLNKRWSALVPGEASIIRESARRILAGESVSSVVRDLNSRGILSPGGGRWTPTALSNLLRHPRLVGDRVYRGAVVAEGCFPATLSRDDFARLSVILARPGRRVLRHVLTGLLICGRCGGRLYMHMAPDGGNYVCARDNGCGRIAITARLVEAHVFDRLFRRARRLESMRSPCTPSVADPAPDAAETRRRLSAAAAELSGAYNQVRSGELPYTDYLQRRRAIDREIAATRAGLPQGAQLRAEWPRLTIEERQGVLMRDVERVTVYPAKRTGGPFDPTRVRITWWSQVPREAPPTPSLAAALRASSARRGRHAQRWLTLEQAAKELGGISSASACRLVIDGLVPAFRDNKSLLFRAHEIADFMAAARVEPKHRR